MGRQVVKYERDGETKYGIWTTICDAFVAWDMTFEQLGQEMERHAVERAKRDVAMQLQYLETGTWRPMTLKDAVESSKLHGKEYAKEVQAALLEGEIMPPLPGDVS